MAEPTEDIPTPDWYKRRYEKSKHLRIGFDPNSRQVVIGKSGVLLRFCPEEAIIMSKAIREILGAMYLCKTCGRDLRSEAGDRCPECNTSFQIVIDPP